MDDCSKIINRRMARIYAALDVNVDPRIDLAKPTAYSIDLEGRITDCVEWRFRGTMPDAKLENDLFCLIGNICSLYDHVKQYARKTGISFQELDRTWRNSSELQILQDLNNRDKHSDAEGRGDRLPRPKLLNINRVMRLHSEQASFVGVKFQNGSWQKVGTGEANLVITADVVAADGSVLGDLHDFCQRGLTFWENLLERWGVDLEETRQEA